LSLLPRIIWNISMSTFNAYLILWFKVSPMNSQHNTTQDIWLLSWKYSSFGLFTDYLCYIPPKLLNLKSSIAFSPYNWYLNIHLITPFSAQCRISIIRATNKTDKMNVSCFRLFLETHFPIHNDSWTGVTKDRTIICFVCLQNRN